jgi:hypothetical protein
VGKITRAHAYANNEVAYIAWEIDGKIEGCLGFEVTRVYLKPDKSEAERVKCAAWVAFKGQRNPYWLPQTPASGRFRSSPGAISPCASGGTVRIAVPTKSMSGTRFAPSATSSRAASPWNRTATNMGT